MFTILTSVKSSQKIPAVRKKKVLVGFEIDSMALGSKNSCIAYDTKFDYGKKI